MEGGSWDLWNERVRDRRSRKVEFIYVSKTLKHQNMLRGHKLIILII